MFQENSFNKKGITAIIVVLIVFWISSFLK
jgi:hypothetical protein